MIPEEVSISPNMRVTFEEWLQRFYPDIEPLYCMQFAPLYWKKIVVEWRRYVDNREWMAWACSL